VIRNDRDGRNCRQSNYQIGSKADIQMQRPGASRARLLASDVIIMLDWHEPGISEGLVSAAHVEKLVGQG
jgi:hypothetical protein